MTTNNKKTTKNEIFLQIYLPLIFFIFIIILVALLSILSTTSNFDLTAHWANISLVLLSIPAMVIGLLTFILLALVVFGLFKLNQWLPIQLKKLYALVLTASAHIWIFMDKISQPIIEIKVKNASIRKLFKLNQSQVGGDNGD